MTQLIIILVEPQLGENIGMAMRAMWNCGVKQLRLVAPRDGWPNAAAESAAAGAVPVLESVQCYATLEAAIEDLPAVYATTARTRFMQKEVWTPRTLMNDPLFQAQGRVGILFGAERSGLSNDHVALADGIIEIPVNPEFPSLNLAQAVYAICYEYYHWQGDKGQVALPHKPLDVQANKADLIALFHHLEAALDDTEFLTPPSKRPAMVRNIRNTLQRARMTTQEVRTWRGIIRTLWGK